MCYAKPGPRCSKHAREALLRADAAVEAALAAGNPDAYIRAREDADAARDAYDRTPDGIRVLRDEGELERAAQYERERERQIAQYNASKALLADGARNTLFDALYNERDAIYGRHDANFGGSVLTGVDIARGADGVAQVTFTYDLVLTQEAMYTHVDGGELGVEDFADDDTADADLAAHADRVNAALLDFEDTHSEDVAEREREALEEITGVPGTYHLVDVARVVNGGVRADDVERLMEDRLEQIATNSYDEDELRKVLDHPLATEQAREEARAQIAYLED